MAWLAEMEETDRDARQNGLLGLLTHESLVRLRLDATSADYNRRLLERSWESLADVAPIEVDHILPTANGGADNEDSLDRFLFLAWEESM